MTRQQLAPYLESLDERLLASLRGRSMLLTSEWNRDELEAVCNVAEIFEQLDGMRHPFSSSPIWARWSFYYVCILFLIFFGEYNDQAFIYFQF